MRQALLLAVGGAFLLAGCGSDGWFGVAEDPPLPGERIAVLALERALKGDPEAAQRPMQLPEPVANADWPQAGGAPFHAIGHPALGSASGTAWSRSIGAGSGDGRHVLAQPVVAQGRVYAMDAVGAVGAFALQDGSALWSVATRPEGEEDSSGGGIAFADGHLFAATGYAEALALDASSGAIVWRQPLSVPARGAPTVDSGRLYVATLDNKTYALDTADGSILWTHDSIEEQTALLGGASPAVAQGAAVSAYSSGEIVALKVENGRELWSDNLTVARRADFIAALADVQASPVVYDGRLYALSNSGRAGAIDMRSGRRIWNQHFGGLHMPWLAGTHLFAVTERGEVVAVEAATGAVRWVMPLARYEDEEDRTGRIDWAGPVLAGGRLVLAGSHGEIVFLDPETGAKAGTFDVGRPHRLAPVVAAQTLLLLDDNGVLTAYR